MSYMVFNFESQYLRGNTEIGVILPDKPRDIAPGEFYGSGKKYKVLWLLHGTYGDYSDWIRKSNIELYACENDLVVVMPSALNSSYTDWHSFAIGYDMNSYFTGELMPLVYNWLPVSDKKEDNYIAGLSMGGSGALKYTLTHPELFAGTAVLSAAPSRYEEDLEKLSGPRRRRIEALIKNAGGLEELLGSNDNIWRLAELADPEKLPPMYVAIGGNDGSLESFERFKKLARDRGFNAEFEVVPGYEHEWRVWDITIRRALEFFGFDSRDAGNAY